MAPGILASGNNQRRRLSIVESRSRWRIRGSNLSGLRHMKQSIFAVGLILAPLATNLTVLDEVRSKRQTRLDLVVAILRLVTLCVFTRPSPAAVVSRVGPMLENRLDACCVPLANLDNLSQGPAHGGRRP